MSNFHWVPHLGITLTFIRSPSNSMYIMKIYRESGSPYLMPLDRQNASKQPPLNRTEILEDDMQLIITLLRKGRNVEES